MRNTIDQNSKPYCSGGDQGRIYFSETKSESFESEHQDLSVAQQCMLLGITRQAYYFQKQTSLEE